MQTTNLQIAPGGVKPVIHVSQYDVGRQFSLRLFDGSLPYTPPTGALVFINGEKPDGKGFSYTDNVSVDENVVTITTTIQMTLLEGTVRCELRIYQNGLNIGTVNFDLVVEHSPLNENTPISETEIPAIIELAEEQVLDAEAWANGTRNGVPVLPTDPTYHKNAKWWAENPSSMGRITDEQYADLQSLFS